MQKQLLVNLVLFLSICVNLVRCAKKWWLTSKAESLTQNNFTNNVGKDYHYLIEFYSKQCYWCEQTADDLNKLAEYYNFDIAPRKDVRIAKVDGPENIALSFRYKIQYYPTIILVKKANINRAWQFLYDRTFEKMKSWLESSIGPEVKAHVEISQVISSPSSSQKDDKDKLKPDSGATVHIKKQPTISNNDPSGLADKTGDQNDLDKPKLSKLSDCTEDTLQAIYDQVLFALSQQDIHDNNMLLIKEKLLDSMNGTLAGSIIRDLLFFSLGIILGIGIYIIHKKLTALGNLNKFQKYRALLTI